jgi:hypothetical protein
MKQRVSRRQNSAPRTSHRRFQLIDDSQNSTHCEHFAMRDAGTGIARHADSSNAASQNHKERT